MKQPIRMLIADDSHVIQKLIAEAAAKTGLPLRISATDNGRECLTLLQGREIDLAFIDVQMPDLSGIDAFWAARKQGVQTFVTLISSPPSSAAVELARKFRAYEFLFKPFGAAEVAAIMRTYARIKAPTRVLVVDDSHTVRHIVQKTIADSVFECEIAEAADGTACLDLCRTSPFDVVFLDCNMPGLSGIDTLQRLRALWPELKVVMISSERDAAREVRARKYGAHAFLAKPFNADDIDRVLHGIHGLRSPNLRLRHQEPEFDVAIEGSTIRLVHAGGDVFEYLWFKEAPYLRNATVQRAASQLDPAALCTSAELAALHQLSVARLLDAA
jgi:DNA-binding NtrC family response regulator